MTIKVEKRHEFDEIIKEKCGIDIGSRWTFLIMCSLKGVMITNSYARVNGMYGFFTYSNWIGILLKLWMDYTC